MHHFYTCFRTTFLLALCLVTGSITLHAQEVTFNPSEMDFGNVIMMNSDAYALARQPDGKLLIGRDFTSYNGTGRNYVARVNGAAVACPDLIAPAAPAPPAIVSSESSCTGCALSGGVITAPATACPTGATLQYSTDGGSNWSTTLPTYDQSAAVTVLTRCVCDTDNNTVSPTSSVTTVPGVCTPPTTPAITGSSTYCPGGSTTLSVAEQAGATYCWQNTANGSLAKRRQCRFFSRRGILPKFSL